MLRVVMVLAQLFLSLTVMAQDARWQWAVSGMETGAGRGNSVTVDQHGYVYVAGHFTGGLSLDTISLSAVGKKDAFVAKYSQSGRVIWAKKFGGPGNDNGMGIAVDSSGAIYLAGTFQDSIILGSTTFISQGQDDIFLSKLDKTGNVLWATSAGSPFPDLISFPDIGASTGIALDNSGNVYIAGSFDDNGQSPPSHDTIKFATTFLVSKGSADIIIAKYSPDGVLGWTKSAGGTGSDAVASIDVDSSHNVYITGALGSWGNWFDSIPVYNPGIFSCAFVAKYDSSGKALWAKIGTSPMPAEGRGISADDSGNSYITGSYIGRINFGGLLTSDRGTFLMKFNPTGTMVWSKSFGGSSTNLGTGVAIDKDGNVLIVGSFSGVNVFDSISLSSGNAADIFVAKLNPAGQTLWAKQSIGSGGHDLGNSVACDLNNNVYVTGYFESGDALFGNSAVNNSGSKDMFLAKLIPYVVSIPSSPKQWDVRAFPNPATSTIAIRQASRKYTSYSITNTIGQNVLSGGLNSEKEQVIELPTLPDGVYYLTLLGKQVAPVTQKLIIHH